MATIIRAESGTMTDASGTIATGATAQSLASADEGRIYLMLQNHHATSSLWIDFDGTTAVESQPSVEIGAGLTLTYEGSYVPNGAISIIGPTTSQAFTCKIGTVA